MALFPAVAAHVECLARASYGRRRDVDAAYDAANSTATAGSGGGASAQQRRESERRRREDGALASFAEQMTGAIGKSHRPVFAKASTKPAPARHVDETAAAALGVPPAADFHTLPYSGIPEVGAALKAALAAAYRLWPTLKSSKTKFDEAFDAHLARVKEGETSSSSSSATAAAATAATKHDAALMASVRAWRVLVVIVWAHAGPLEALAHVRRVVAVERRVADRAFGLTSQPPQSSSSSSAAAPAPAPAPAVSAAAQAAPALLASAAPPSPAPARRRTVTVTEREATKVQAACRRWLARRAAHRRRTVGDEGSQRALRRIFAVASKHFGQRRDAAATCIEVVADVEATQRRVDSFWEHEEAEFKRQWAQWERGARTFYFESGRCPIDPSEWAFDSKAGAAASANNSNTVGSGGVFVHLPTGRRTEEHPNTNKFVAARSREQLKAGRAREARKEAARRAEADAQKLWTVAAGPALAQLAAPGPSLPPTA